MAWLKKKADPISERARALNHEIAKLEAEIQQLDARLQRDQSQPRLRSTAMPHSTTVSHASHGPAAAARPSDDEPVFEEVAREELEGHPETGGTPEHYNELGVRKYDVAALLRRIRGHFHGPSTSNPKLVSYLAAGGIQGLRPLRYEKRVQRNRFIFFAIVLFFTMLGTLYVYLRGHR